MAVATLPKQPLQLAAVLVAALALCFGSAAANSNGNKLTGECYCIESAVFEEGGSQHGYCKRMSCDFSPESAKCFPADATVVVEQADGLRAVKPLDSLRIGDKTLAVDAAGQAVFSPVIAFLHREPAAPTAHMRLVLANNKPALIVSPSHLVLAADSPTAAPAYQRAGTLRAGQVLFQLAEDSAAAQSVEILALEQVQRAGAIAPLTTAGTIVVDGSVASCYAEVTSHEAAHLVLAPLRWVAKYVPALMPTSEGAVPASLQALHSAFRTLLPGYFSQ